MERVDTRPSFCALILALPHYVDQLEIPPHFVNEYMASKRRATVTLKGPYGITQTARLHYGSSGTNIMQGWREFAEAHCIDEGDLVLFFYDGVESFDVKMYTAKRCLKNPTFKHKITKTNVGRNCNLPIPSAFARALLPNSNFELEFLDSRGISWAINIYVTNEHPRHRYYICSGWKAFADARKLKEGDVCVFELVEPKLMHVTILGS